jgi:hypothetical protein
MIEKRRRKLCDRSTMGIGLRGPFVVVTTLATLGCGPSPITSARIEGAIAPTFANLVQVQVSRLGLPPMAASDFAVTASCLRLVAESNSGAGDWACTLVWHGPRRQTLRNTYDLSVATDGCYTATVDGEQLGGPVLQASDGSDVRNLLYAFEGCFDTT